MDMFCKASVLRKERFRGVHTLIERVALAIRYLAYSLIRKVRCGSDSQMVVVIKRFQRDASSEKVFTKRTVPRGLFAEL